MEARHHDYLISHNPVEESIWEPPDERASRIAVDYLIPSRVIKYSSEHLLDRVEEPATQALLLRFVS
jgi:hypothetical protein